MKKLIIFTLCMGVLLCGCGKKADTKNVDALATAQAAFEATKWADQVEEMDADTAKTLYSVDNGDVTMRLWMGTGATAEELAVFVCPDEKTADTLYTVCETRVTEQLDAFRDYVPSEVTKLEKPLILKKGSSVYLVIADDTAAAQEIIEKAYK